ncbi:MAG TPA: hypothetical protein VFK89_02740, partial [Actinomycetota bacterium]|nr:hypothetical protein [Actinomycetota bacterium]
SGSESWSGPSCSGGGGTVTYPPITSYVNGNDIYDVCAGRFDSPFLEFRGESESSTTMDLHCKRDDGNDHWTLDGTVTITG